MGFQKKNYAKRTRMWNNKSGKKGDPERRLRQPEEAQSVSGLVGPKNTKNEHPADTIPKQEENSGGRKREG